MLTANYQLVNRFRNSHFQSAQFGQSAQAADARVAGVGLLAQVVHHLVSVVGTHGDGDAAALLQFEEGLHHAVHVDVALQVVGLVEVSFSVALGGAQVHEVDTVGEAGHHGGAVVGAADAERTGAEAEAVAGVGHGVDERLEVFGTAHDAWQAQDGHGRVVGMDDELHAHFVGHGADFAQEVDEVPAQAFGRDVLVAVQFVLELLQREAFFRTGQASYHVADEFLLVFVGHLLEAGACLGLLFVGIVGFGAGAFQQEEVEGDEGGTFEAQGTAAVGQFVGQVGACPVEHGHEVVGDDVDAALGEVAQAFLVVVDVALKVACLRLDVLMYGHALYDGPREAYSLDHLLAFHNLFYRPHLAVGDVVQGIDDAGGSGLLDVPQADWVVRPVPAPGLFAKYHIGIVFLRITWQIH